MINNQIHHQDQEELISTLQKVARNKVLLASFLKDILTPAELREITKRLQIAKLLCAGKTQRYIEKKLHVGVATVTRGSRVLLNRSGGFNQVFRKSKNL
jgi:TrpR family transcriptional regulator, trp operon repressor